MLTVQRVLNLSWTRNGKCEQGVISCDSISLLTLVYRYKSNRCEQVETVPLLGPNMLAYFELCHIRACFASKDDMLKVSWLMMNHYLNGVLPATYSCAHAGNGQGRAGLVAVHPTTVSCGSQKGAAWLMVSAFLAGRGSCKRGSGRRRSKSLWWRCSGIESGGKGWSGWSVGGELFAGRGWSGREGVFCQDFNERCIGFINGGPV